MSNICKYRCCLIIFSFPLLKTYLQSMSIKFEEWRIKQTDTEEWMRHRQLPEDLQERVRRFMQYKWFATRGVDEESILRSLPLDLCHEIQRHLCLNLVRRVSVSSYLCCYFWRCFNLVSGYGTHPYRSGRRFLLLDPVLLLWYLCILFPLILDVILSAK